ncbi:NADH dehydrogenase [ubiquinone] 1 beta subcomplex subunit 1 isoform X2 [Macrotis lagotis]|uniref:NADH dehydrogenase [ubiquinone] 1 beta subcomplex subunit 1 isoform X2 n=1 Tax=Macrotis lagotis TaxID=92651 RepID=UPI003D68B730
MEAPEPRLGGLRGGGLRGGGLRAGKTGLRIASGPRTWGMAAAGASAGDASPRGPPGGPGAPLSCPAPPLGSPSRRTPSPVFPTFFPGRFFSGSGPGAEAAARSAAGAADATRHQQAPTGSRHLGGGAEERGGATRVPQLGGGGGRGNGFRPGQLRTNYPGLRISEFQFQLVKAKQERDARRDRAAPLPGAQHGSAPPEMTSAEACAGHPRRRPPRRQLPLRFPLAVPARSNHAEFDSGCS